MLKSIKDFLGLSTDDPEVADENSAISRNTEMLANQDTTLTDCSMSTNDNPVPTNIAEEMPANEDISLSRCSVATNYRPGPSREIIQTNETQTMPGSASPDKLSKCSKNLTANAEPQRKKPKSVVHPPTKEMVMDAIKDLKKRNGVTFEDIKLYIEQKYEVNMPLLRRHILNYLEKSAENGILVKIDGKETKFKIKTDTKKLKERKQREPAVQKTGGRKLVFKKNNYYFSA